MRTNIRQSPECESQGQFQHWGEFEDWNSSDMSRIMQTKFISYKILLIHTSLVTPTGWLRVNVSIKWPRNLTVTQSYYYIKHIFIYEVSDEKNTYAFENSIFKLMGFTIYFSFKYKNENNNFEIFNRSNLAEISYSILRIWYSTRIQWGWKCNRVSSLDHSVANFLAKIFTII